MFSIASACASDVNDTIAASEDQISIEMQQDDLIEIENPDNDELSVQGSTGTFTDLAAKINSGAKEISLDTDYKYDSSEDSDYYRGIEIKNPITIDGKGHAIYGTGTRLMFDIVSNNVLLKNIEFQAKRSTDEEGRYNYGGIDVSASSNVNFINCSFNGYGYIHFENITNSVIRDCNFYNSHVYEDGTYIRLFGNNNKILNCNFLNCSSEIIRIFGNNQEMRGCNFKNCHDYDSLISIITSYYDIEYYENGEVYYEEYERASYNCTIADCIFDQISSEYRIIWCEGFNTKFNNCTFIKNGGTSIYAFDKNVLVNNCTFTDSTSSYGTILCNEYSDGCEINNSIFVNSLQLENRDAAEGNGGSISFKGNNGIISNCIFINSTSTGKGGAVYSIGNNLTIDSNTFINNNALAGSSIFIYDGIVKNNNFDRDDSIFALRNVKIIKKIPSLTLNDITFNCCNPINYIISLKCNNAPLTNKKIIFELFQDDYHINYDLITNEEGNINIFNLIRNLDVGTWNMKVTYSGDSNYESVSKTSKITVNPIAPLVILDDVSATVNQETIINAVINRQDNVAVNGGVVNFYVNDKLVGSSFVVNNIAHITYCPSNEGTFTLKAVFEDSNILSSNNVSKLVVNPEISKIDVNQNISYNNNQIDFNLPEDATGVVTITICSKVYATNVDGKVNVDLSTLSSGNYDYVLSYSGDDKYSSFTTTGNLNVENAVSDKIKPSVEVPSLDSPSADGSVTVKLPDDATGIVTLSINKKDYHFAAVNGAAKVMIPNLDNGNYPYTIAYSGDSKYSSYSTSGSLKINKTESINPAPAIEKINTLMTTISITSTYNENNYLVATLKDSKGNIISGKTVSVNINGLKTFDTDANGQIKVSTIDLTPDTYISTFIFAGDNKYNGASATGNIVINKAAVKLTAKAKTIKLNDKTKKYTIILKNNVNKYMVDTAVKITVNKKTYSAKTNSKGVATFKLTKLTKKGKYDATVKYAGDQCYKAKSINVKITVK